MKKPDAYEHKKTIESEQSEITWGQGDEEHFLYYGMPCLFDRETRETYLMDCGAPDCHSFQCDLPRALDNYMSYIDFRSYDWRENKVRLRRICEYVKVRPPRLFVTHNPLLQRTLGKRPIAIYTRAIPWYNTKKDIRWTIFKQSHKRPLLLFDGETLSEFLKQELENGSEPTL